MVFLKSKGLKRIGENLETRVRQMAHQLNISDKFKIFLSDHIQVPAMIGFLKPVILLPVAFLNNLSIEETEAILIHELAHISRKDYLFNLLQTIIETVLFFNPFVWLLSKIIREEREKACDEIVVEYAAPVIYARALLSIENTAKPLLAQAVSGGKYRLLNRIKNFTIKKNNTMNAKQKIISVLIVSMGIVSIAWLSPKPQAKNMQNNIVKSSLTLPPNLYNIDTPIISIKPEVLPAPPVPPMPPKAKNESLVKMPPPPPPAAHTLPYSVQQEIDSPPAIDSMRIAKIHDFYNSREWKKFQKQMEEKTSKISEFYKSPKWKKYQKELQRNAEKISNFYNSKQWEKSTEELMANADRLRQQSDLWSKRIDTVQWNGQQDNYKQLRKQMKGLQKQINDKVWKAQSEALQRQAEQLRKDAEIYRKKIFDNPEWKAQQKDMEEKMRQLSNDLQ
ncbi:MAG: M56 family metallopeptidase [Arachidicoccus sp.]|nr:M56 family metallopeptidase [Arachidicoccus sp.]